MLHCKMMQSSKGEKAMLTFAVLFVVGTLALTVLHVLDRQG